MPTQEERIAALEQKTAAHIQEMDENFTIMVGVIRHQGQDIKRIFQRLDTMDESLQSVNQHLGTVDERLDTMDKRLNTMDARFDTMDNHLNSMDVGLQSVNQHLDTLDGSLDIFKQQNSQFETILNEHTSLLSQILARLPKTP